MLRQIRQINRQMRRQMGHQHQTDC